MSQYTLRLGYSSSPSYGAVIRTLRTVPGYAVEGDGRQARHSIPVEPETLPALAPLVGLLRRWRSTELLVDGVAQGIGRLWALERVIACHQARRLSGLEELYCLGLPGPGGGGMPCRLIDRSFPWSPGPQYQDSVLLPRLLRAHARQAMVEVCPAYDHDLVERAAPAAIRRLQHRQEAAGLTMRSTLDEKAAHQETRDAFERLLRDVDFGADH